MNIRLLKSKMALQGFSRPELASKAGLSVSSLQRKLSGRGVFSVDEARDICNALSVNDLGERAAIFLSLDVQN